MVNLVKQDFGKNKQLFEKVKHQLQGKIGADKVIEHVGSTAIPNMIGKNIIDILVGAKNEQEFNELSKAIEKLGYFPSARSRTSVYQFFASKKEETHSGDTHIHLVIENTQRYNEFLILREYLLNNEAEAIAYANIKKEILSNITAERQDYRSIKSEYVTKLLERTKKNIKI